MAKKPPGGHPRSDSYSKVFFSGKESVFGSTDWFFLEQEWPVFVLGHSFDSSQQRIPLEMHLQLMQAKTQFSESSFFKVFSVKNLFLEFSANFQFFAHGKFNRHLYMINLSVTRSYSHRDLA